MSPRTSRLLAALAFPLLGTLVLGGCATRDQASPVGQALNPVSRGASIGPSGYATILSAPPAGPIKAAPAAPPPPPADGKPTPLPMTSEAVTAREMMMNPDNRQPAVVNLALLSGRLILRSGCFRLMEHGEGGEPLVIFGRDVELGLDAEGYMALRDNGSDEAMPRIGERMMWAGPQVYSEADPAVASLRAKCGAGPIIAVGSPGSAYRDN